MLCSDPWRVCCCWSVYHRKTLDVFWLRELHCVTYSLRDWLNFTASYPHHSTLQTSTATPVYSGGVCLLWSAEFFTLHLWTCVLSSYSKHSLKICCWFCRTQFTQDSTVESPSFPGSENVHRFFCFLDYCNELIKEAPRVWQNHSFCVDHVCIYLYNCISLKYVLNKIISNVSIHLFVCALGYRIKNDGWKWQDTHT